LCVAAIARAVLALKGDRVFAETMGANARRYVERHFRWQDLIRNWLAQMQLEDSASRPSSSTETSPKVSSAGSQID